MEGKMLIKVHGGVKRQIAGGRLVKSLLITSPDETLRNNY